MHRHATLQSALAEVREQLKHKSPNRFAFAVDLTECGKKRYVTGTDAEFVQWYAGMPPDARHVHEVLAADRPCNLFVDLEYEREQYPQADEQAVVGAAIALMKQHIACAKTAPVVMMSASDDAKMSWHVVFRGAVFRNCAEMGQYVRHVVNTHGKRSVAELFYGLRGCVVDLGVYGNNRTFRVLGSRKLGSSRVLRRLGPSGTFLAAENVAEVLDTLVVCRDVRQVKVQAVPKKVAHAAAAHDVPDGCACIVQWMQERFPGVKVYGAKMRSGVISAALLSRKCVIAKKVHKSNHVTCHVDLRRCQWYMGCFKCRGRGPMRDIADPRVVQACSRFGGVNKRKRK